MHTTQPSANSSISPHSGHCGQAPSEFPDAFDVYFFVEDVPDVCFVADFGAGLLNQSGFSFSAR